MTPAHSVETHGTGTAPSLAVSVLAGIAGGLVGSWAMTRFHVALYGGGVTGVEEPQSHRPIEGGRHDPATKAAEIAARPLIDRSLTHREKQVGGPIMHYLFGASMGAVYGALSSVWPGVRRGAGVPFGVAVWVLADEIALPLLGLAHPPQAYPFRTHAEMLAAHVVFGYMTHDTASRLTARLR